MEPLRKLKRKNAPSSKRAGDSLDEGFAYCPNSATERGRHDGAGRFGALHRRVANGENTERRRWPARELEEANAAIRAGEDRDDIDAGRDIRRRSIS